MDISKRSSRVMREKTMMLFGAKKPAEEEQNEALSKNYKQFLGAKVLWPPSVPDDILDFAVREADIILKQDDNNIYAAKALKKLMDRKFEPYWHVFIGESFGALVHHETNRFLFFYIGKTACMLYKIG